MGTIGYTKYSSAGSDKIVLYRIMLLLFTRINILIHYCKLN